MAEPTILSKAVASSTGNAATIIITLLLGVVLAGAVGWYVLNRQSAAISSSSYALATGGGSAVASKQRNNTILITGPVGSGKTELWCKLRFKNGKRPRTQMSMSVNAAESFINEAKAYLVDIPGHQKYRFEQVSHLAVARGVVFMVDSTAVADELRQTAELLYDTLANAYVQKKETPILFICNKQDEKSALSNIRIRQLLEDEIDKLRSSRQAGLDSLGVGSAADGAANDEEEASDFLGYDGKKFSFDDLPNSVQFNESSMALAHDASGLEQIEVWISDTIHG
ncbi:hypothetical protein GGI12_000717 [Dipsacomyces acuminosporus]|nr:hypothetical protein GGI12_000717 [Dipsacomyces acuminosporus]